MSAYSENFKLIDWSNFKPTPSKRDAAVKHGDAAYYMPDIAPFVSPMSGKVLSSRKQVKHEERGYGVRQCGELDKVSDFDPYKNKPQMVNERALERAFGIALEKHGLR